MKRFFQALLHRPCVAARELDAALKSRITEMDEATYDLTRAIRDALDITDRRHENRGRKPDRRRA